MRLPFLIPTLLLLATASLFAASGNLGSAFDAVRQLPRGEAKKLARIEARDGTPVPERWHFIVHDPKEETGVHEYVVAGGEVVASRSVSQFAESVREQDVFGLGPLRIDSDRVAKLAQDYAFANNVTIASLNYALKKEGADAVPLWNVACLDETGKDIGHLVVSAGKGNVVSHEGFELVPAVEQQDRPRTQASYQVASRAERERQRRAAPRTRTVQPPPEDKSDVFSRIGRFFTGH
jgi:hypothetical protein